MFPIEPMSNTPFSFPSALPADARTAFSVFWTGDTDVASVCLLCTKEDSTAAVGEVTDNPVSFFCANDDSISDVAETVPGPGAGWYFSLHSSVN